MKQSKNRFKNQKNTFQYIYFDLQLQKHRRRQVNNKFLIGPNLLSNKFYMTIVPFHVVNICSRTCERQLLSVFCLKPSFDLLLYCMLSELSQQREVVHNDSSVQGFCQRIRSEQGLLHHNRCAASKICIFKEHHTCQDLQCN